jgi:PTS system N-acetylgalactosamine-specific IIA component
MSNASPARSGDATQARAIVAGHGDFAAGLVSAVEQITGRGAQLIPIAVHELRLEDIEGLLRERMRAAGVRVIFTDLQAGSCTMAARRLLHGMDDAVLVAGANLPTLLDFVFAEGKDPVEAARHAAERGRGAITVHATAGSGATA